MSFGSLGLIAQLQTAVAEQGYRTPTPIQQQAIPLILEGRDVMAGAQTGTGKTAGFALPILQRLAETQFTKPRPVRALVLVPTRELAVQVHQSFKDYGRHVALFSEAVFGGVSMKGQAQQLRRGCDIVVATPGRLLDHARQGNVDLGRVDVLVLDEADRMLDMGFKREVEALLALLPERRQNLLFSATFSNEIKSLAKHLLHDPVQIEAPRQNIAADSIRQSVYPIKREYKRELLSYLVGNGNWRQVLVFVRTKHGADRLGAQLIKDGIRTGVLHGDKSQGARMRALDAFKNGRIAVLVATDVAARGLDIDQLPHVVNFDLPSVAEDYVHRIGRTGRAGREGEAISLVCPEEASLLFAIEKLLKKSIPRVADTGYEPVTLSVGQSMEKRESRSNKAKKAPVHRKKSHPTHEQPDAGRRPYRGGRFKKNGN